jgi:hypothetical protein
MEATEMSEFGKEMREAGEASMTHVSLIISVLAVLVAMVTVLGHREHTEAVLQQGNTTDQWNEYQARRSRVELTQKFSDMLALQPTTDAAATAKKLDTYKAQMQKWNAEDDKAQEQAKEFEAEVTVAERKAARFDLGEALLEIAVVLASITLLTRHQRYVVAAGLLGLGGVVAAASAFLVR